MKIALILTMILTFMSAKDLIYPNGRYEAFILKKDKSRGVNSNIYYKNGLISPKTEYKDTRKLYVSFGKEVNIDLFCKKYFLKFIKITNQKFYTALFVVEDSRDIVDLCSNINQHEEIRYAKPNWIAPRRLN